MLYPVISNIQRPERSHLNALALKFGISFLRPGLIARWLCGWVYDARCPGPERGGKPNRFISLRFLTHSAITVNELQQVPTTNVHVHFVLVLIRSIPYTAIPPSPPCGTSPLPNHPIAQYVQSSPVWLTVPIEKYSPRRTGCVCDCDWLLGK